MVLFVKSSATRPSIRESLRRTWPSLSYVDGAKFAAIFLIGKASKKYEALIAEESKRYGDILLLNVSDDYRHIAEKTLGGMKWARDYLNDDDFYSSCDDDIMINMGGLVNVVNLMKVKIKVNGWPGFPIICTYRTKRNDAPDRRRDSKYFVSYEEYPWPFWPDFCLGGAYTSSIKVVRQLLETSRGTEPLPMDDVWITGVLREKIGMPRQYIRELSQPLAIHYFGFHFNDGRIQRKFMKEKWEEMLKRFNQSDMCFCI